MNELSYMISEKWTLLKCINEMGKSGKDQINHDRQSSTPLSSLHLLYSPKHIDLLIKVFEK